MPHYCSYLFNHINMLIMKLVIATLYLIHLNSDIKAAMFGNS